MSESLRELIADTRALLAPGDIDLVGAIVLTDIERSDELAMTEATLEIGKTIADHATDEETYVYSGNDDPDFAATQHQGLTLEDDAFVWECQQLYLDGQYVLVFYYERVDEHDTLFTEIADLGYEVIPVDPEAASPSFEPINPPSSE